jgi:HlyD family secretion protein
MRSQLWKTATGKKKLIIGVMAIFLGIGAFIAVKAHNNAAVLPNASGKLQTTVDVMTVSRTNLIKRVSLTGPTVPEAQVDIAAKYQGKVTAVYSALGQQVSAGDVLVTQDIGDAEILIRQNQAAYQQASADAATNSVAFQASYNRAKADYQRAVTDNERYQSLYAEGAISRQALDANQQSLDSAKSALETLANQMNSGSVPSSIQSAQAAADKAQQSINAVAKQRDDLVLRAPRSGVIGYRQVEVGSMVSAGQKLLSIVDNSNIYVDCQVSEQDLGSLALDMPVNVQIDSLGKSFPGKIIYISPASDVQNLSFSLRIALINPDASVKGGMFTRTVLNAVLRPNTLVVPKEAVIEKNGQSSLFVINSQNAAEQRTVQVGAHGDQNVEILSGINEGEQIAVSNLSRIRAGMVIVPNNVTPDSRGDSQ